MAHLLAQARLDFPALGQKINGHSLVYLDTAATSLKPIVMIEALEHFNKYEAANVHRGAHYLSDRATEKFENSRKIIKNFINANSENEIIFTRGTTESINFVAQTYGEQFLSAGDEIILTEMEHHSNIVPWQILAKKKNLTIRWAPVTDAGELDLASFKNLLSAKTKIVSIVHCSNTLGTVNPIHEIIELSHQIGAKVLIDAAQSITCMPIDVQKLNCDFLAFSGHKLYGPFGVGVLYGKRKIIEGLAPIQGGGAMIADVTKEGVTFLGAPQRFEAGTPNISGVIGLGVAIQYIKNIGLENILAHEREIAIYALKELRKIDGLKFIGESLSRINIISFIVEGLHQSDIGQILDQQGVAVRTGHHCTQPLMKKYGIAGTLRASFGVYSTQNDVDILVKSLKKAAEILR